MDIDGKKLDGDTKRSILAQTDSVDRILAARDILINDNLINGGKIQVPNLTPSCDVEKEQFKYNNPKQRKALRDTTNILSTPVQPTTEKTPRSSSPGKPTKLTENNVDEVEKLTPREYLLKALENETNPALTTTPVQPTTEKTPSTH